MSNSRKRSKSPPTASRQEKDPPAKKRRKERDEILQKILNTVENLSKRVELIESGPSYDERVDALSLMADEDLMENMATATCTEPSLASIVAYEATVEPTKAPVEPTKAPVEPNEAPVSPKKGTKQCRDTRRQDFV